jgi:hypothetical protein
LQLGRQHQGGAFIGVGVLLHHARRNRNPQAT